MRDETTLVSVFFGEENSEKGTTHKFELPAKFVDEIIPSRSTAIDLRVTSEKVLYKIIDRKMVNFINNPSVKRFVDTMISWLEADTLTAVQTFTTYLKLNRYLRFTSFTRGGSYIAIQPSSSSINYTPVTIMTERYNLRGIDTPPPFFSISGYDINSFFNSLCEFIEDHSLPVIQARHYALPRIVLMVSIEPDFINSVISKVTDMGKRKPMTEIIQDFSNWLENWYTYIKCNSRERLAKISTYMHTILGKNNAQKRTLCRSTSY